MKKPEITWKELLEYDPADFLLLDIRGSEAYKRGHIDGAVAAEPDFEGDTEAVEMTIKKAAMKHVPDMIAVYCQYGEKSLSAVEKLRSHGYKAVSLAGGYLGWLKHENSEMERYDRQIILPQIGYRGQRLLKKARVLIIGAGGLGSPAALYLAGAGTGTIGIADADVVSLDNLHRQIIHSTENTGMLKTDSSKERIKELNPYVRVVTYPFMVTPDNISELISGYDFIIDAVDRFETKFLINDACVIARKPFCHGGILQFTGQAMTYVPDQGPCYRCIFEEVPEAGSIPTCSEAGVIGAVCGIIGSVQALEAIKYITGAGQLLTGRMFVFDGLNMKSRIALFPEKSDTCRVCSEKRNIADVRDNRSEYELRCIV